MSAHRSAATTLMLFLLIIIVVPLRAQILDQKPTWRENLKILNSYVSAHSLNTATDLPSGQGCGQPIQPDSIALANSGHDTMWPWFRLAGMRLELPTNDDTIVVKIRSGICMRTGWSNIPLLRALDLERDGLTAHYLPEAGWIEPLEHRPVPFVLIRSRDGSLQPATWDGSRFIEFAPLAKARTDSARVAAHSYVDQDRRERAAWIAKIRSYGWPAQIADAVISHRVIIGMRTSQVRASVGAPESINKTIIPGVVNEQWVYGSGFYVYLTNGVVSGIQTSQ